ncbi:MAG: hypothetical protein Q8900_10200 [Bacillota bacterium]|nr:hypothetical protein [Bacillota bacterium]
MEISKIVKDFKKEKKTRKIKTIILTVITIIICISMITIIKIMNTNKINFRTNNISSSELNNKIYNYLQIKSNRLKVYEDASKLNNNSTKNACVYFLSEVLRNNNINVPNSVCNTSQLISFLNTNGWKKNTNYKDLKPGNICFTTDEKGNMNGVPSHTYVFMGWVKKGSYDYAYICDNQAKDYEGKIYHIRNIKISVSANGFKKDAFSFFMEKK